MNQETIQIKCPYCGAVLIVKNQPGIESKLVTCPVCKQKSTFSMCKKVDKKEEEHTQYPDSEKYSGYGNTISKAAGEDSKISFGTNFTLGKLDVISTGQSFQLKQGRNVIGRRAQASSADIQIPSDESKRMSREHLIIEVKKVPTKGFVHYVSLFKEKSNKTFIGNEQLEYGDCIVLKQGDIIKLPDITIRFQIPDEEGTEF